MCIQATFLHVIYVYIYICVSYLGWRPVGGTYVPTCSYYYYYYYYYNELEILEKDQKRDLEDLKESYQKEKEQLNKMMVVTIKKKDEEMVNLRKKKEQQIKHWNQKYDDLKRETKFEIEDKQKRSCRSQRTTQECRG